jgi:hypothetical protein
VIWKKRGSTGAVATAYNDASLRCVLKKIASSFNLLKVKHEPLRLQHAASELRQRPHLSFEALKN